jgi:signal transduction histidine kinase
MPGRMTRRNLREVSADHASAPILARLRQTRKQHELIVRWLGFLAPALLILYVVDAAHAQPYPGRTGRGLVVSIAVAAFVLGVLVRNVTVWRPGRILPLTSVAVVLAGSGVLMWLQPNGPGAEGVLVGLLFAVRWLPERAAVPALIVAFVAVEIIAWADQQVFGSLAVLAAFGAFYGMLFLAYRLSQANKQAEVLVAELKESRAAEARAAGLAERQRLAREMHDVLAHSLSGLLLQLEGARMLVAEDPADPRLPATVERAHHLGRSGLEEARRAIGMLRDDALPGPERLPALAAQFEQDRAVPCRLVVSGAAHELGSEARLALYRVAQEALTNITKHALPERVEMRLAYEPSATRLIVEDYSRTDGNDPSPDGDGGGYGLTGMRERAELIGGTLTTGATRNGFRVELDVPA